MTTKSVLMNHIARIEKALQDIPLGQDGLGSATISTQGMKDAQEDIRKFRMRFNNYVMALFDEDEAEMILWLQAMENTQEKND